MRLYNYCTALFFTQIMPDHIADLVICQPAKKIILYVYLMSFLLLL